jgi:diguanylate cyclase (GGDEF)-like protein
VTTVCLPVAALAGLAAVLAGTGVLAGCFGIAWRRARYAADHDPLTGLPNRRGLARRLVDVPAGSWVAILDMDGLKAANTRYGHAAGDALIRAVGARLATAATRTGGYAARLGGDEFAILLPSAAPPSAGSAVSIADTAAAILDTLAEPVQLPAELVPRVPASLGLARVDWAGPPLAMRRAERTRPSHCCSHRPAP